MTHKRTGGVQGGDYYLSELRVNLDSLLEGFEHVEEFDGIVQDVDTFSRQSTLS
jgi:cell division control protein 6